MEKTLFFGLIVGCWEPNLRSLHHLFFKLFQQLRKARTVAKAMVDHSWVSDISGVLSLSGLMEYLELWDALTNFQLNNTIDQHHWKFESSSTFSSKSAYRAFFIGSIQFELWKCLWKSWAPNKCKIFVWLTVRNRCWTADRLQKKGAPTSSPLLSL